MERSEKMEEHKRRIRKLIKKIYENTELVKKENERSRIYYQTKIK